MATPIFVAARRVDPSAEAGRAGGQRCAAIRPSPPPFDARRPRGSSEEATTEGTSEVAAVREALGAGRLTVPDPETGFRHSMYAVCPHDGTHAPVRRVERGARGAITRVTARCPRCGAEMAPAPEGLHPH